MEEVNWRSVVGYEGLYEVSDTGLVMTLEHWTNGKHIPRKLLKAELGKRRYSIVKLYKNGTGKIRPIHRLVAEAFIDNPENKPQVNHIDGNRLNNNAGNLEWCTPSENIRHAVAIGLQNPLAMADTTKKGVIQLTKDGKVVCKWDSLSRAARECGLSVSNICACCKGRIKSTGGFRWEYDLEH